MAKEDRALGEFLNTFDERKRKESQKAAMEMQVIAKKRKTLAPIRDFLTRFDELGLVVPDAEIGAPGVSLHATKRFNVYEAESSPTWAPGISLYFDHPAQVEIAIPNENDIEKQGVIVIRSVTRHRDIKLLEQKFTSVDAAKDALARFLGKTAISLETDPRKKTKSALNQSDQLLSDAPKELPGE